MKMEKGYVREIGRGTGELLLAADSGSLGQLLRSSYELCQEAGDELRGLVKSTVMWINKSTSKKNKRMGRFHRRVGYQQLSQTLFFFGQQSLIVHHIKPLATVCFLKEYCSHEEGSALGCAPLFPQQLFGKVTSDGCFLVHTTVFFVGLLFYNLLFRLSSLKCTSKQDRCLGMEEKIYRIHTSTSISCTHEN